MTSSKESFFSSSSIKVLHHRNEKKYSSNSKSSSQSNPISNDSNIKIHDYKPAPYRIGGAIRLNPDMYQRYTQLHDCVWPEVLERMYQSNIRNFTLYYHEETHTLFSHFEWIGNQLQSQSDIEKEEELHALFDQDMKNIASDPTVQKWWSQCEPCQIPFSQFVLSKHIPPSRLYSGVVKNKANDKSSNDCEETADRWAPLKCLCHCGHWPVSYSNQQYDPLWIPNNPEGRTCSLDDPMGVNS